MIKRSVRIIAGLCLLGALCGCQHYYMVQDPTGNKTYYTDKIYNKDSGAVAFHDLKTGAEVTLQNSEVREINKSELPPGTVK